MAAHDGTKSGAASFAEACQMVLSHPSICDGKLIVTKHDKRKYNHGHYHFVETLRTVKHGGVKIFCKKNLGPNIDFKGRHPPPYGAQVTLRHYHCRFDPKLGKDMCSILHILCVLEPFDAV